jgi:hypothetical protein
MKFTSDHLMTIQRLVDSSPLSIREMRENAIDHLACAVEYRLLNGIPFDEALDISLKEFAPAGLKEIEHETYLLLHSKTIVAKKVTYASGLIFSMMASLGVFFKILHWNGANELVIVGFGGLATIFLPLLSILRKSMDVPRAEKYRQAIFLVTLFLLSVGAVLKVWHFAGANEFLLLGTVGFSLGFLPLTFLKMYKEAIAI